MAIAADGAVLRHIATLPPVKRQPSLLFAALRLVAGSDLQVLDAVEVLHQRWDDVATVARARSTQTNEPARCGTFVPLLARLPQPLALIEVGAAAGLCLYPDRYTYRYGTGDWLGSPSPVTVAVDITGPVPVPTALPTVVWRAGLDLNPLDAADAEHRAWLDCCIWPEHAERRRRLTAATSIAAADPPILRRGDLLHDLDEVLAAVPAGATPVVFHSAVLAYLDPAGRWAFAEAMARRTGVVWLSNEAPSVLGGGGRVPPVPPGVATRSHFVLVEDGRRVHASAGPHGQWLSWA